jgi:hypothetical protein
VGLNALINIQYNLSSKLAVGFNIDAIGVGFGSSTKGTFITSESKSYAGPQDASPTSLNVLLVGNNDIGQLKSEFYLDYLISQKLGLRAGADLTFSEYTTKSKLAQNNDRFRYKAGLIFLGLSLKI